MDNPLAWCVLSSFVLSLLFAEPSDTSDTVNHCWCALLVVYKTCSAHYLWCRKASGEIRRGELEGTLYLEGTFYFYLEGTFCLEPDPAYSPVYAPAYAPICTSLRMYAYRTGVTHTLHRAETGAGAKTARPVTHAVTHARFARFCRRGLRALCCGPSISITVFYYAPLADVKCGA